MISGNDSHASLSIFPEFATATRYAMSALLSVGAALLFCFAITTARAEEWVPIAPPASPAARQGHSMVTMPDGRVFLFGGEGDAGLFNDLYAYENSSWTEIQPVNPPPPIRRDHQAWVRGDAMFIYGGYGSSGALNDMWSYSVASNTWQQVTTSGANVPVARHGHAAKTLSDGTVLIVGGIDDNGDPLNDCWQLNGDNTFTRLADAPYVFAHASIELVANEQLMFVLGRPGVIAMYQFATKMWGSTSGGPPISGYATTSQGVNDAGDPVIYTFGGKDSSGEETAKVYVYNLNTGQTTQYDTMPYPVVNGASCRLDASSRKLTVGSMTATTTPEKGLLFFGGLSNGVPMNKTLGYFSSSPSPASAFPWTMFLPSLAGKEE